MKPKLKSVASRHPKVVTVVDSEEDTLGATSILASHIDEYRTIPFNDDTTKYLQQTEPLVLLLALGDVEKSVEYYKFLVDDAQLCHIHYSVILCNNKESSLAFRCCMKGLFDNYFVFQPLYEKLRLLMVVQNGLVTTQSEIRINDQTGDLIEKIDEELFDIIEAGSQCKKKVLDKIANKTKEFSQLTEESVLNVPDNASPQELMSSITKDHISPLLAHLEDDIRTSLDNMLAQLLSQKMEIKESTIQKPAKRKGLITHIASVKKRAQKEDEKTTATISTTESKELDTPEYTDTSRILVVEDNSLYREMISSVLSKENYEVEEAEDGLCALKKIQDEHYDLILMDLFMPNLDGLNATKKIRSLSGGRDIPVIALTGNKNKEVVKKWAHYGLKGYIVKPSTKIEILSAVKKVLHLVQEST
jgi:CheY-like chemotaxis protein